MRPQTQKGADPSLYVGAVSPIATAGRKSFWVVQRSRLPAMLRRIILTHKLKEFPAQGAFEVHMEPPFRTPFLIKPAEGVRDAV